MDRRPRPPRRGPRFSWRDWSAECGAQSVQRRRLDRRRLDRAMALLWQLQAVQEVVKMRMVEQSL